jgi:hypothetical protein
MGFWRGNPRSKNSGWRSRSFCPTKDALLRCVREYCGEVEPSALAQLTALPDHHERQNLDVLRTDQARRKHRASPMASKASVVCDAGE